MGEKRQHERQAEDAAVRLRRVVKNERRRTNSNELLASFFSSSTPNES